MGNKLDTNPANFAPTPVVQVRGNKGETFKGKLVEMKEVPGSYKDEKGNVKMNHIYEFEFISSTMGLQMKDGKEYVDCDVTAGERVAIFAPSRLHNGLSKAAKGQIITITYQGIGKANQMGGKPHLYDVEAE